MTWAIAQLPTLSCIGSVNCSEPESTVEQVVRVEHIAASVEHAAAAAETVAEQQTAMAAQYDVTVTQVSGQQALMTAKTAVVALEVQQSRRAKHDAKLEACLAAVLPRLDRCTEPRSKAPGLTVGPIGYLCEDHIR